MSAYKLEKKKVLVTGCCGMVGSELVRQLPADYLGKQKIYKGGLRNE